MKMDILEIKYGSIYFDDLIKQELLLWPDNEFNDLYSETKVSNDYFYGAIVDDKLIGFIQIAIRNEYVNGTSTSPVGFIEAIYVLEEYREKGYGRRLVEFAFDFVRNKGCKEIASDALIDNYGSHDFHKRVGFKETERVIFYLKKLD